MPSQAAKIPWERPNIIPSSLRPLLSPLRSQQSGAREMHHLTPFGCGRQAALCALLSPLYY
ncbi:MAG TPA: hypothetical protein VJ801_15345, partial [Polyangia bacterium]|nr:hypothetical protein [Polyangia bacterium]